MNFCPDTLSTSTVMRSETALTVPIPTAGTPVGRAAERPRGSSYGDPMFEDYRWVAMLDPVDYAAPRRLARALRDGGSDGVVYPSVRHAGGQCVGLFFPDLAGPCVQARHLIYAWDGRRVLPEYAVATLAGGS